MPANLNEHDLESLTKLVAQLPPGRSMITNDGLTVRRRQNTSGYDCRIGPGGFARIRKNTAQEAAEDLLTQSASLTHPSSLGGATSFSDYNVAIDSVRRGESLPEGPSPAVRAMRTLALRAGLHSYRIRAQQARDALANGNVGGAIRQLEAIIEHAGNNGRLKDVQRAERALDAVREHHEIGGDLPQLQETKVDIRQIGAHSHVFVNSRDATGPLTRSEAESRKAFFTRKAARAEDVASIDKEIADLPSTLTEDDEAAA